MSTDPLRPLHVHFAKTRREIQELSVALSQQDNEGETCPPRLAHETRRLQGMCCISGLLGIIKKTKKEREGGGKRREARDRTKVGGRGLRHRRR